MNAHMHIGFIDAMHFALLLIIVGFTFRVVEAKLADTPIGKALAYVY